MATFRDVFPRSKCIIAMLHVFAGPREQQIAQAQGDLEVIAGLVDGAIVENYGWGYEDHNLASSQTAQDLLQVIVTIRGQASIPIGLNLLPNDYDQAITIAYTIGAPFIQLDHVTGEFVSYESVEPRRFLETREDYSGALVLGGIHPKYYVLRDPTVDIRDSARQAMALADAIVVTGNATGDPASLSDLRAVREVIGDFPLIIGSGLTPENAAEQLAIADGAIVGTALKRRGVVPGEPIGRSLVEALMAVVKTLR